jgi:hypothetical protein
LRSVHVLGTFLLRSNRIRNRPIFPFTLFPRSGRVALYVYDREGRIHYSWPGNFGRRLGGVSHLDETNVRLAIWLDNRCSRKMTDEGELSCRLFRGRWSAEKNLR